MCAVMILCQEIPCLVLLNWWRNNETDINKCKYSGYDTVFDMYITFLMSAGGFVKNVMIFTADYLQSWWMLKARVRQ